MPSLHHPNALQRLVNGRPFQALILGVIVAAAVLVGIETDPTLLARHGTLLHWLDRLVLAIFVVEIVLKMAQHGRHCLRYFRDPWNVFDFLVVAVCLLPFDSHQAAVLRLVRVVRALRLVTAFPQLRLLISALLRSIPSMGYVGLLLAILFYMYAVLGVLLWRDNDPTRFGNLPTAMLTLFTVVTLEGWNDVLYTQVYGSDVHPYDNPLALPRTPQARPIAAVVYFVSFVLLGTMIMLNLFIGVIVNSMSEAQAERAAQLRGAAPPPDDLDNELAQLERRAAALAADVRTLRERAGRQRG
jgi:voltage-gated sodium channel